MIETGDRQGEALCYENLGPMCHFLGKYAAAKEYLNKALPIQREIGDKKGEASCYANVGTMYLSLGEYGKAKEYLINALATQREIGDKKGEAACYANLGTVYLSVGAYAKAVEYLNNALAIQREIGNKEREASCCGNLGTLFRSLGKYLEAKRYHEKALAISREISDINAEAVWHLQLAYDIMFEGNVGLPDHVYSNLFASINKCEKMRSFLGRNDQLKISLLEDRSCSYHLLSALLYASANDKDAVCVLELARADLWQT